MRSSCGYDNGRAMQDTGVFDLDLMCLDETNMTWLNNTLSCSLELCWI